MADCNIRDIDDGLMRAVKLEAIKSGRTMKDWVVLILARAVGWGGENGEVPVERSDVESAQVQKRDVPEMRRIAEEALARFGQPKGEEEIEPVATCPECGETLVFNKVMKWWQCSECEWHRKKER